MWAVVEIGKKQYIVSKGDLLEVERLKAKEGEELTLDTVLLLVDKKKVKVGTPYVAKATVKAKVQGEEKAKKVVVYKYKRRKKYRRKQGHRQTHTILKISSITATSTQK